MAAPGDLLAGANRLALARPIAGSGVGAFGVWESLFKALRVEPDFEYVLVGATICKGHADASGAKRGAEAHAIGRSKGGLTTKIHAAVDALGLPIRFILTPGEGRLSAGAQFHRGTFGRRTRHGGRSI